MCSPSLYIAWYMLDLSRSQFTILSVLVCTYLGYTSSVIYSSDAAKVEPEYRSPSAASL
jgi:hypothetical protein